MGRSGFPPAINPGMLIGNTGFQPVRPAELHSAESIKHSLESIACPSHRLSGRFGHSTIGTKAVSTAFLILPAEDRPLKRLMPSLAENHRPEGRC